MPDLKCFICMYLVGSCVGGALFPDTTSTQYLRFKFTLIVLDFRHVKYCSMCMYVYVKHNVKQSFSAVVVKESTVLMQEVWVWTWSRFIILAWKIPGTEEPGGLQPMEPVESPLRLSSWCNDLSAHLKKWTMINILKFRNISPNLENHSIEYWLKISHFLPLLFCLYHACL